MSATTQLLIEVKEKTWKLVARHEVPWHNSAYPEALGDFALGIPKNADVETKTAYCANGYAYNPICATVKALKAALESELQESQLLEELKKKLKYSLEIRRALLERPDNVVNCEILLGIVKDAEEKYGREARIILYWAN